MCRIIQSKNYEVSHLVCITNKYATQQIIMGENVFVQNPSHCGIDGNDIVA
jgi:hypothetical protein